VDVGLNDPQVPAGVQLQVTPAALVSLETVAATLAVPPAAMVEGGAVEMTTAMGCGPGPGEAAEPQPCRKARARIPRKRKLRFMSTPEE
jgi:hypothetical protein